MAPWATRDDKWWAPPATQRLLRYKISPRESSFLLKNFLLLFQDGPDSLTPTVTPTRPALLHLDLPTALPFSSQRIRVLRLAFLNTSTLHLHYFTKFHLNLHEFFSVFIYDSSGRVTRFLHYELEKRSWKLLVSAALENSRVERAKRFWILKGWRCSLECLVM